MSDVGEAARVARPALTLPAAMVIGPMKTGTTWIHRYLEWRGDVRLPSRKETFFFDLYYYRGLQWYREQFANWEGMTPPQTVEVAPSLFHCPEAPDRIRASLGAIPLVVTTRDPVARSWSHYLHMRRYGYTRSPLARAVEEYPEILTASRYDRLIARWQLALPESQIVSLPIEELHRDPQAYAAKLCAGLELPFVTVPAHLMEREYVAATAMSFYIARLGRVVSRSLRSAEFYSVIHLARRMGLRRVFYGHGGKRPVLNPSEAELNWLRKTLAEG